ncbi:MAG: TatD family hydrolase, partial [Acidobacteria bacterium]|nr:TatD family hydrolase [Acidobacteriota bacterium]
AGVSRVLCVVAAGDDRELAQAARLRALWPETVFSVGVHPHQARDFPEAAAVERVVRAALEGGSAIRAIGEIGLDYHYDFSPRDVQRDVFRAQVGLARDVNLPIVVHTREAEADTFAILEQEGRGRVRGVFHCFTGRRATAERALALGFHVSFAGIITFPTAGAIRDAARRVPADRLLIETDSPFLAPVPHRGRRNEPALVARVLEALAEVRGESRDLLEARTTEAFAALTDARPARAS